MSFNLFKYFKTTKTNFKASVYNELFTKFILLNNIKNFTIFKKCKIFFNIKKFVTFSLNRIIIFTNVSIIFNKCFDFFFDKEASKYLSKRKHNTNFIKYNKNLTLNNTAFLDLYIFDTKEEIFLKNNDSNKFNLKNEIALFLVKKRLLFLKKQNGKYHLGLAESFNLSSILLSNNLDSFTTVVPVFYFLSTLYN